MKPTCERCAFKLAVDGEAYICSYECSFCVGCAQDLDWICPNCGGELVARPRRQAG
jgi:hypothetical protein